MSCPIHETVCDRSGDCFFSCLGLVADFVALYVHLYFVNEALGNCVVVVVKVYTSHMVYMSFPKRRVHVLTQVSRYKCQHLWAASCCINLTTDWALAIRCVYKCSFIQLDSLTWLISNCHQAAIVLQLRVQTVHIELKDFKKLPFFSPAISGSAGGHRLLPGKRPHHMISWNGGQNQKQWWKGDRVNFQISSSSSYMWGVGCSAKGGTRCTSNKD